MFFICPTFAVLLYVFRRGAARHGSGDGEHRATARFSSCLSNAGSERLERFSWRALISTISKINLP